MIILTTIEMIKLKFNVINKLDQACTVNDKAEI